MGKEIERKFLVNKDKWEKFLLETKGIVSEKIRQGYILADTEKTIRIRIMGTKGFIAIKGKTTGLTRDEFEYEIPLKDAEEILNHFCTTFIVKIRYSVIYKNNNWVIDEFHGNNEGLLLAEIELENENRNIVLPEWTDREVSTDPHYFNSFLASKQVVS